MRSLYGAEPAFYERLKESGTPHLQKIRDIDEAWRVIGLTLDEAARGAERQIANLNVSTMDGQAIDALWSFLKLPEDLGLDADGKRVYLASVGGPRHFGKPEIVAIVRNLTGKEPEVFYKQGPALSVKYPDENGAPGLGTSVKRVLEASMKAHIPLDVTLEQPVIVFVNREVFSLGGLRVECDIQEPAGALALDSLVMMYVVSDTSGGLGGWLTADTMWRLDGARALDGGRKLNAAVTTEAL